MKKPTRPGTPNALSGIGTTINLCQRSRDRLTWARHVTKRALKAEAASSVLVRRALVLYTQHLEELLQGNSAEQREAEAMALSLAAQGGREALPEDGLIAVPLRPFSSVESDARQTQVERGRARIDALLSQPIPTNRE